MRVTKLCLHQYRNIEQAQIEFSPGVNILYGDNAHGKTNVLESVWLFSAGKSFRTSKEKDLIMDGREQTEITLSFYAYGRDQSCKISLSRDKGKATSLNGVKLKKLNELFGNVSAVLFAPEHLNIVDDGPDARRRFLDIALSQLRPRYVADLVRYQKVLTQKNALLKDARFSSELIPMLDAWDAQAARLGSLIIKQRETYLSTLSPIAGEMYEKMTKGEETLKISYKPSVTGDEKALYDAFLEKRRDDLNLGFSGIGPHRDDIEFLIKGKPVRQFGSRGQRRSSVICLKLAEQEILKKELGEYPILLLDDIMGELDPARQQFLLNRLHDKQVIITCCDKGVLSSLEKGRTFHVKNGCIEEERV